MSMIVYIYGEDNFRSRQYLNQTVDRFRKERDPQGLNVVFIDGKKDEITRIWDEMRAAPFLAEKRMIVAENILSGTDQNVLDSLAEGIKEKKFPENNVVVFWQGERMGKSKSAQTLNKLLAKERWAREFTFLSGAELTSWIKKEVAGRSGSIHQRAADYLAQNFGNDMWHLDTLMDQLLAHSQGQEITLADAQLFLEEKVEDSIFAMVDAIVAGNCKLSYKLINEQRRRGEEDHHLFAMILRQFRILVEMRDLFNRNENMPSAQMAQELEVHPYVAKKSLPAMKRFSLDKLKKIYEQLLEIDIKTKTGLGEPALLLDLFVRKLG